MTGVRVTIKKEGSKVFALFDDGTIVHVWKAKEFTERKLTNWSRKFERCFLYGIEIEREGEQK